ncbi:DUF6089 family protein [Aureisphaera galaxeae]|uniref:type IX secretion system protein PorG n=1 Tax=Aureisphaera galaxeae TaxID=1538023 RepID=UPI0023510615|nr:DUF6089 family protein [Aureisphaera galaxeae]MDC8005739.1 DUF6089 family protein [Aureisphaera galaxeae]
MKYFATVVLLISLVFEGSSQTYEVGGFIGGSNYIGDVGKTSYIAPNDVAFGGIFKWNRSARHAFRGSLIVAGIQGNDLDSGESRRQQRGYEFQNTVTEISVGIEYTFWEYNLYSGRPQSTPYLYTGLTYFFYDDLYKRRGSDQIVKYEGAGAPAIPMVVGFKTSVFGKFILGMEIGARYTFTDNLDGNNPDLEGGETLRFGNINSDDWYVFTGVTLTYTFGRRPCYCNF